MRNIIDVLVVAAVGFCFGICLGIAVTRGEADRLRKIIEIKQSWRDDTSTVQQCIDAASFSGLPCNLGKPDAKY